MSDDCFGDLAGVKLPVALSAADVRSSFPRPTRDAKVDAGYCAQEELTTACLPTLVLVGVQKGGTTEFEHYMGLSEQIFAPGGETAWFHKHSDAYDRDMAKKLPITPPWWHYVAHRFNMSRIMSSHGSRHYRVIFEKMAMFVTPSVVRNIRSILPSAVLILLMREPGARAQSHFQPAFSTSAARASSRGMSCRAHQRASIACYGRVSQHRQTSLAPSHWRSSPWFPVSSRGSSPHGPACTRMGCY